jgi:hypothetical protein
MHYNFARLAASRSVSVTCAAGLGSEALRCGDPVADVSRVGIIEAATTAVASAGQRRTASLSEDRVGRRSWDVPIRPHRIGATRNRRRTTVPPNRDLLIVSRDRIGLYETVRHSPHENVEVRLDRRLGDRRARFIPVGDERRRRDRRTRDVAGELARFGWALVPAADRS